MQYKIILPNTYTITSIQRYFPDLYQRLPHAVYLRSHPSYDSSKDLPTTRISTPSTICRITDDSEDNDNDDDDCSDSGYSDDSSYLTDDEGAADGDDGGE